MKEFLIANWEIILAVIIVITVIVLLAVFGKRRVIYKVLYTLVTDAENAYGKGEGAAKLAEVMRRFYELLPGCVKIFITYGTMKKWIEQALIAAKKRWAEKAGVEADTNDFF